MILCCFKIFYEYSEKLSDTFRANQLVPTHIDRDLPKFCCYEKRSRYQDMPSERKNFFNERNDDRVLWC